MVQLHLENEGLVNLNGDAELAFDTGRELGSPALTHQMFPTTLRALLKELHVFTAAS